MAKVLLVEDDPRLKDLLLRWLKKEGYLVELVTSGEDALQLLAGYGYDLIILDWGLPGLSGVEVLRKYRSTGGCTPVILLTGKGDIAEKKEGLDSGADDYLCKPFNFEELLARMRSLLRRPPVIIPTTLSIGNLTLDLASKKVCLDGNLVKLGKKEYSILEFLIRHPNQFYSSKQLMEAVWPSDSESGEAAVRNCVKVLRSKITSADGNCIVSTVPGSGYTIITE